ncbi:MFS transporter [Companilactobacillus mishanensis]|uniref:MFS transporter n=1 Tax=Companilactobacillus mishanensis TaxID=2486008 RepID=A0ABW9PA75_9LACO|nr:MFS transporter [Companilactobacillus mishanensis]MQS45977.1 MFS transporter [Companilactobacillus mishanensis]MQS90257.1 MFS transporter [Companilactobacillus mishanensis]
MSKAHLWKQRGFYGLTDMAGNLIWQMVGLYLLFYYTTVLDISAAFVGTLFLVVRFIDAFDGMFFGFLIDHTHSKYGKARPYFLWFGIPLGVLAFLLFCNPSFGGNKVFQMVWISIIYTAFSLVYSGANTPITAILPSLTKDPDERANLASARMVLTNTGTAVIGAITIPMVHFLGANNNKVGFLIWGAIVGVVIAVSFILAFANLKELPIEVEDAEDQKKTEIKQHLSVGQSFKYAFKNKPWVVLTISFIAVQTFWVVRLGSGVFFIDYIVKRPDIVGYFLGMTIFAVPGNLAVPFLSKKFKNRNVMDGALVVFIIGSLFMLIGEQTSSLVMLFVGNGISMMAMGSVFTLAFIMIADTVEYARTELHIEEPGFLSSVPVVGAKIGMGLGGALSGWILTWGGFASTAKTQSAKALSAINVNFIWLPIILAVLIVIILSFYRLNEKAVADEETDNDEIDESMA